MSQQKHNVNRKDGLQDGLPEFDGLNLENDEGVGGGHRVLEKSRGDVNRTLKSDPDVIAFSENKEKANKWADELEELANRHFGGEFEDSKRVVASVRNLTSINRPQISQARFLSQHFPRLEALIREAKAKLKEAKDTLNHEKSLLEKVLEAGYQIAHSPHIKTDIPVTLLNNQKAEFDAKEFQAGDSYEAVTALTNEISEYNRLQIDRINRKVSEEHVALSRSLFNLNRDTQFSIEFLDSTKELSEGLDWKSLANDYKDKLSDLNVAMQINVAGQDVFDRVNRLIQAKEAYDRLKKLSDNLSTKQKTISKQADEIDSKYETTLSSAQDLQQVIEPLLPIMKKVDIEIDARQLSVLNYSLRQELDSYSDKKLISRHLSEAVKNLKSSLEKSRREMIQKTTQRYKKLNEEVVPYLNAYGDDTMNEALKKGEYHDARLRHALGNLNLYAYDPADLILSVKEVVGISEQLESKIQEMKKIDDHFNAQSKTIKDLKAELKQIQEEIAPLAEAFEDNSINESLKTIKEQSALLFVSKKTFVKNESKNILRIGALEKEKRNLQSKLSELKEGKEMINDRYQQLQSKIENLMVKAKNLDENAFKYEQDLLKDDSGEINPEKHQQKVHHLIQKLNEIKDSEERIDNLESKVSNLYQELEDVRKSHDFKKAAVASRSLDRRLKHNGFDKKFIVEFERFNAIINEPSFKRRGLDKSNKGFIEQFNDDMSLYNGGYTSRIRLFGQKSPSTTSIRSVLDNLKSINDHLEKAGDVKTNRLLDELSLGKDKAIDKSRSEIDSALDDIFQGLNQDKKVTAEKKKR